MPWDATPNAESVRRFYEDSIQPALDALAAHGLGRVVLAGFTIFTFLLVYGYVNETMPPRVDFYTPLDAAIPFWPGTIFIYLSMYLLFAAAAVYVEGRAFLRGLGVLVLVCIISLIFFVLLTAHYPRPDPSVIENPLIEKMFTMMFAFDAPGNTFPSLHVGTTTTAVGSRSPRRFGIGSASAIDSSNSTRASSYCRSPRTPSRR